MLAVSRFVNTRSIRWTLFCHFDRVFALRCRVVARLLTMGKEAELIKAAKKGDLKFLERYLGQQNKRTSVIGR